jgi:hypothetical protein
MTIKTIIIKYLIVALLAFALGTFFPNPVAKKKTENATIAWAKSLGFGPPRFEYHNNQEFITSLKKCISYLNSDIPKNKHIILDDVKETIKLPEEFIPLYKKGPLDGDLIAWFSSEFDVSMGPMGLRGLPGLILRVNYTIATAFRIEATEIKTLKRELIIPEKGITVEKEKVWKRDWSNKEIKSIKQ